MGISKYLISLSHLDLAQFLTLFISRSLLGLSCRLHIFTFYDIIKSYISSISKQKSVITIVNYIVPAQGDSYVSNKKMMKIKLLTVESEFIGTITTDT